MIKFRSFLEGLRYRSKCPLCSKQMEVNDRDLVNRLEYPLGHPYQRFTFYLGQRSDDVLLVDPNSEIVVIKYANTLDTNDMFYSGAAKGNYNIYNGEYRHGLTINCNSCSQYHFTLQIHSNLTERRLIGTFLNSESVSIEENDAVHEVRNVYSTDKTEYACFPKDGSSKRSSIPLVPLNISDPKETISRIRKLLIFS